MKMKRLLIILVFLFLPLKLYAAGWDSPSGFDTGSTFDKITIREKPAPNADTNTGKLYVDEVDNSLHYLSETGTDTQVVGDSGVVGIGAATTSTSGISELATAAETTTGTDTSRNITPDGLAGSDYGKRVVSIPLNSSAALTTGDGKQYLRAPDIYAGWNIVAVSAARSAGNGTDTYMLRNVTQGQDVLSTILTLDAGELDSNTADVPAVIDTGQDDLTLYDRFAIDVDSVGTDTTDSEFQITLQLP